MASSKSASKKGRGAHPSTENLRKLRSKILEISEGLTRKVDEHLSILFFSIKNYRTRDTSNQASAPYKSHDSFTCTTFPWRPHTAKSKMGAIFSSKPSGGASGTGSEEGESAVVAVHSKARWDELWDAHKSTSKLMVIDFSASWCGPCKFIEPVFKEMASRFTDAAFFKIDVDELSEVARTWRVEAMPTFVLVKGGKEVGRVVGADKDELERSINMFRSSSSST